MSMFLTVADMCEQMHMDKHTAYELAGREEDPLPLRYLRGNVKYGRILQSELDEWWLRNSVHYKDRKKDRRSNG